MLKLHPRPQPLIAAALMLLSGCGAQGAGLPQVSRSESIKLESSSFAQGTPIPAVHTCDGEDVPPPLTWTGGPPTDEYVLILTDPDAPGGTFTHWVVFGIPGTVTALTGALPAGAKEGANDFDASGYRGPCPPPDDEPHRYVFTVYSLRSAGSAAVRAGATLREVLEAIQCCIQAKGTLTGTYDR